MCIRDSGAYVGFIANNYLQLVDISWIVGMVLAGGLYFAFTRNLDLESEAAAIARSEAVLAETGAAR